MKIGEKEIEIKDLDATIKCSKKILEHIRKRHTEESSSKNKSLSQEQVTLSEQEKCFRTTLVKVGLLTFCAMGLGKSICQSYDKVKDEEKKLGIKLSNHDIHQIIIDTVKKHSIII